MSRHRVTKIIHFSYGHRLLNYDGECRFLHGHNGVLEVDVEGNDLDQRGMVVDFALIRDHIKGWVDDHLDHRMLLCERDPLVPVLQDRGEPVYVIDRNPTAENIARHIFEQTSGDDIAIAEIRLWETASSYATYRAP